VNTSLQVPGDPGRLGTLIYLQWKQEECVFAYMCVLYLRGDVRSWSKNPIMCMYVYYTAVLSGPRNFT
jgi:hypothetical protein